MFSGVKELKACRRRRRRRPFRFFCLSAGARDRNLNFNEKRNNLISMERKKLEVKEMETENETR